MPEYKAPKQQNKKEEPKKVSYDRNEVVSAYSEEGQRRNKHNGPFSTSYKILFFSVLGVMVIALILFLLWRNGTFSSWTDFHYFEGPKWLFFHFFEVFLANLAKKRD